MVKSRSYKKENVSYIRSAMFLKLYFSSFEPLPGAVPINYSVVAGIANDLIFFDVKTWQYLTYPVAKKQTFSKRKNIISFNRST